jgi:glycosyltransferase involved in cell wall biosynthesis
MGAAVRQATTLMVGTDPRSRGGIASVLCLYREAGLFQKVRFLASYTDGGLLRKLCCYLAFLAQFGWILISQPGIRLVHIHTASRGSFLRKSIVMMLAKAAGKKTIMHVHGAEFNQFYERAPAPLRKFIGKVLGSADAIVALSRQWERDLHRISGNSRIRIIYNPTKIVELQFHNDNTKPASEVNFLFMGRLGQRKGVFDIIEAARLIRTENVKISLYGDGDIESVRTLIVANGVEDKVQVRGWIEGSEKERVLRAADVLILPSYNEGFPVSILEAMARGMPVLATNVGGVAEAVEDGVNGYLITPGECEKLAERIERLALSSGLRRRMGRSGHALASRKFALPVIVRQLEKLYDELGA